MTDKLTKDQLKLKVNEPKLFEPGEDITTGDVVAMVMNKAAGLNKLTFDEYELLSNLIGDAHNEGKNSLLKRFMVHMIEQTGHLWLPGGKPCTCKLSVADIQALCEVADEIIAGGGGS